MKTIHLTTLIIASATLLLTACGTLTSSGDIVVLGRNSYAVNSQSLSLLQGKNDAAASGVLKAEAYCNQQGKHMEVTGSDASPPVTGVMVSKTMLIFTCID